MGKIGGRDYKKGPRDCPTNRGTSEGNIQDQLRSFMSKREWLVERMIGNAFQLGIPDLYCRHRRYGERWIDVKRPKGYTLTRAQKLKWPIWESFGVGIWILTAASQSEYQLLFRPPNWRAFFGSVPLSLSEALEAIE